MRDFQGTNSVGEVSLPRETLLVSYKGKDITLGIRWLLGLCTLLCVLLLAAALRFFGPLRLQVDDEFLLRDLAECGAEQHECQAPNVRSLDPAVAIHKCTLRGS